MNRKCESKLKYRVFCAKTHKIYKYISFLFVAYTMHTMHTNKCHICFDNCLKFWVNYFMFEMKNISLCKERCNLNEIKWLFKDGHAKISFRIFLIFHYALICNMFTLLKKYCYRPLKISLLPFNWEKSGNAGFKGVYLIAHFNL